MSSGPATTECPPARPRLHQQRKPGVGGDRLEFADRPDEPERRGGQAQLVGGQPAQGLPVGGEPDGAGVGHQLGELVVGASQDRLEGLDGRQVSAETASVTVTTKSGCSR